MALLERLAILITADAAGALSEMKKVADSAEKDLGKAGAAGGALSAGMTKVGAAMVGVGAGMLMVGINAASTATDLGREVIKLQRYTGLTAEEASKLGYAAKMSGVDVDTLSTGLGKLAKTMDTAPQKFTKLGVEVKTSDGHLRGMTDVLGDVADKIKAMGPGTESTAAAIELFGRNGASMLPFLLKGKDGIAELSKEAEKMGLVLSQDNVNSVKESIKAQREFGAAITGLKTQIGLEMLPVLTTFTKLVTELPGPVKDLAGPFIVIGGAVLVAGGAFLLVVGQVKKAQLAFIEMSVTAKMLTAALGYVTLGLTLGIAIWQTWSSNVSTAKDKTKSALDEMVAAATTNGFDGMGSSIANLRSQADKLADASNGWNHIEWFWDRAKHKGDAEGLRENAAAIEELQTQADGLSTATGRTNNETLQWLLTMRASGKIFPDTATALASYTGKIDRNKISSEEARLAQDGFAASIDNANKALKATTDPFFAVIHAQDNLTTAQTDYNKAVSDFGEKSPQAQAAYVKQVEAALSLNSTLVELGKAQITAVASSEKFQQAMGFLKSYGIDPASTAGQLLIEKISGISWQAAITAGYLNDHPLTPKTDTSQIDEATSKLEAMRRKIQEVLGNGGGSLLRITPTNPTPGVDLSFLNNAMGGRIGPGMAMGGRPGKPILTGELGPEIFWPDSAGTIVTAEKTRQMLSSSGGGGTAVYNINVNVAATADKAAIGKTIVESIAAYERRSGQGWRA